MALEAIFEPDDGIKDNNIQVEKQFEVIRKKTLGNLNNRTILLIEPCNVIKENDHRNVLINFCN